MLLELPDVVPADLILAIREALADAHWVDGVQTAPGGKSAHKRNEQLDPRGELAGRLMGRLQQVLGEHAPFAKACLPARVQPPLIARYQEGMAYGRHLDAPLIGETGVRADLSVTLFLNPPEAYEGGELVVESPLGERRFKGAAGSALVYPGGSWHRVEPVRSGERLVAVSWVQSRVRESERRLQLYELSRVLDAARGEGLDTDALCRLEGVHLNLLRMWLDA